LRFHPPILSRATLALVFVAVVLVSAVTGQSPPLSVISREGRRSLATTTVGDQEFVALDDLAAMFQLSVREDGLGAITATYKGRTIVLTPDQPLASVSGRLVSLPAPPRRTATRRWLVPDEFIRALTLVYDAKLDLRKPSHLVVVGDLRVPRVQVRYEPPAASGQAAGSGGRLTIDATPPAPGAVAREGDRLTVKFDADALDLVATGALFPQPGLIQSVRVADPATLTFDLGPRFGAFKATNVSVDASTRLVIDVAAQSPESTPPAQLPAPPASPLPDLGSLLAGATANFTSIRTIAIDPGHGGDDEGARSGAGVKEKDLALAVARKLKAAVETRMGVRVLLTREDDRAVSIDDRTAVANNGKADLFISLHANASLRPAVTGATISTAFFDDQSQSSARELAPERVPAAGGGSRQIEFVPWQVAQIPHLRQSTALAMILEQQFHGRIPLASRAVESAPLRVLESANMPAVLIEMGYLTNVDQARLLASTEFQNTLVQALFDAVVRFRDALDDEHREGPARGAR
jgi:N-acetylmuramoyl-L-alanine amidase